MPIEDQTLRLPAGPIVVRLAFVSRYYSEHPLAYLQAVKSGTLNEYGGEDSGLAQGYRRNLPVLADELRRCLSGLTFDIVASPPSSHPLLVRPYWDAIRRDHWQVVDISGAFTRRAGVRAALAEDPEEVFRAITMSGQLDAGAAPRVLLIDDVFARGMTTMAMVRHVTAACTQQPSFVVACPLFLDSRPPPPL